MGPDAWSPSQLRRFLRETLKSGLLDQVGTDHHKDQSRSGGGGSWNIPKSKMNAYLCIQELLLYPHVTQFSPFAH